MKHLVNMLGNPVKSNQFNGKLVSIQEFVTIKARWVTLDSTGVKYERALRYTNP
jgi:hypothetical protein